MNTYIDIEGRSAEGAPADGVLERCPGLLPEIPPLHGLAVGPVIRDPSGHDGVLEDLSAHFEQCHVLCDRVGHMVEIPKVCNEEGHISVRVLAVDPQAGLCLLEGRNVVGQRHEVHAAHNARICSDAVVEVGVVELGECVPEEVSCVDAGGVDEHFEGDLRAVVAQAAEREAAVGRRRDGELGQGEATSEEQECEHEKK